MADFNARDGITADPAQLRPALLRLLTDPSLGRKGGGDQRRSIGRAP